MKMCFHFYYKKDRMQNFKKKVYRQVKPSTNKSPGIDKRVVDFGYIIIPDDIPRDTYINNVYRTNLIMIITHYNEVMKDVLVPKNLIKLLKFPQQSGEYGQMVSLICYKEINQSYISHLFHKPGEFYGYEEGIVADQYTSDDNGNVISIISNIDIPSYGVTVNSDSDKSGVIRLACKSKNGVSVISLNTDGEIGIKSDKDINIHSQTKVSLGGDSPLLLGDKTVDALTKIVSHIVTLAGALSLTPVVTEAQQLLLQLDRIKSTKVFTE